MRYAFYILVYVLSVFLVACFNFNNTPSTPKPDELPPATEEGKNTFGCLVNGQVWLIKGNPALNLYNCQYINGRFNLGITHETLDKTVNQTFIISCQNGVYLGPFSLTKFPENGARFADYNSNFDFRNYNNNPGLLNITKIDTLKRIIAGTFEMNMINQKFDTIHITQGRFDMKYQY
jgi:hypothetical protein